MNALPWFRMYAEFAEDPKVQILAFEDQRHFHMLLCLKCKGTLDTATRNEDHRDALIAKALGLDLIAAREARRRLVEGMLITDNWQPIAWDRRQFVSDSSSARVRNFRERQRAEANGNVTETLHNVSPSVSVTPQIQNRVDTEQIKRPVDNGDYGDNSGAEQRGDVRQKALAAAAGRSAGPKRLQPGEPRFPPKAST